jgi:3-oxoacyl-[acyl-carrier-protein] synthase II
VTGLGCVSPVGNTVAHSWANLLAGKSGIDLITQVRRVAFACKIAGEVKGFEHRRLHPEKEARHMDRSSTWASLPLPARRCRMRAAHGRGAGRRTGHRIGCNIGSGIGGLPLIENTHAE